MGKKRAGLNRPGLLFLGDHLKPGYQIEPKGKRETGGVANGEAQTYLNRERILGDSEKEGDCQRAEKTWNKLVSATRKAGGKV